MAAPITTVQRNDGQSFTSNSATVGCGTGTQVRVSYEPQMANGSPAPNRVAATETLPAQYTVGRQTTAYNSDTNITLPAERPAPGQE